MRNTKRMSPLKGKRVRVTRLDECGRPVYGDDAQVVTSGFITTTFTANTSETDEIRIVNANGDTCLLEPSQQSIEGYSLEIQFCDVDPDLFNMMTGVSVLFDADGTAVGFEQDTAIDMSSFGFAFELWTGIKTDEGCGEVGEVPYGYMLLPFLKGGVIADFTVENGALNFTVTGATTRKGNGWGVGPYDVQKDELGNANKLLQAVSQSASFRFMETFVAPPASVPGSRPALDPDWTTLTSVTAITTPASLEVDFEVAPNIVLGEGVWYDFGDGTWDYVEDNDGDTTHTYASAGTYTVRASANGVWVQTTVTVPGS